MTDVDISDYLSGDPETDWRQIAYTLATTLQSFDPTQWFTEANGDVIKMFLKQTQWLDQRVLPALTQFYAIQSEYTSVDPF